MWPIGRSWRRVVAVGLAVAALDGAPALGQADAPDQDTVSAIITEMYEPEGNSATSHVDIGLIEIGPGHRASAEDGMQFQVSLGQIIYPVHARYTLVNGSGASAYVRDWDTHFFAFRSAQMQGRWDLTSNSLPGDVNGELRGG